jgi:hypothetical protein
VITATVLPPSYDCPRATGTVIFLVDGVPAGSPVKLDKRGRASFKTDHLERGGHTIRATYGGGGRHKHCSSSSPNLLLTVGEDTESTHVPKPHGRHT